MDQIDLRMKRSVQGDSSKVSVTHRSDRLVILAFQLIILESHRDKGSPIPLCCIDTLKGINPRQFVVAGLHQPANLYDRRYVHRIGWKGDRIRSLFPDDFDHGYHSITSALYNSTASKVPTCHTYDNLCTFETGMGKCMYYVLFKALRCYSFFYILTAENPFKHNHMPLRC